jgi:hypothetical protein
MSEDDDALSCISAAATAAAAAAAASAAVQLKPNSPELRALLLPSEYLAPHACSTA